MLRGGILNYRPRFEISYHPANPATAPSYALKEHKY